MSKDYKEYMRNLGKKGGKATAKAHDSEHFKKIGRKGGLALKKKFINKKDENNEQGQS